MTASNRCLRLATPLVAAGLACSATSAAVTIAQGASAPTYSTTLTFDEPGGPTGLTPGNAWTGVGISELVAGTGSGTVSTVNTNPGFGWLGTGNVFYGAFGAFLTFSQDVSAFSVRYWDSSGPATFMGGGARVIALDNGVEVGNLFITNPPFGGVGQEWFNITTTAGSTFDEVRMLGFGFFPEAYIDNLSWNVVPTPAASALLAIAGLAATRRRR